LKRILREKNRFRLQLLALGLIVIPPVGLYFGAINGVTVLIVACMTLIVIGMILGILVS
jgi:ABC-type proline/glycine betaine transport system permease subunit